MTKEMVHLTKFHLEIGPIGNDKRRCVCRRLGNHVRWGTKLTHYRLFGCANPWIRRFTKRRKPLRRNMICPLTFSMTYRKLIFGLRRERRCMFLLRLTSPRAINNGHCSVESSSYRDVIVRKRYRNAYISVNGANSNRVLNQKAQSGSSPVSPFGEAGFLPRPEPGSQQAHSSEQRFAGCCTNSRAGQS